MIVGSGAVALCIFQWPQSTKAAVAAGASLSGIAMPVVIVSTVLQQL
jgi:hypothetical protein